MNQITEGIITVFVAIIGVATLALILSPKAQTSNVVQAVASGFGNDLATATAPVTGSTTTIDLSYPGSNNSGSIIGGYPNLGYGAPSLGT